jgi:hypothetical protein
MPAWGLIPDSPVFYYAGKALRVRSRRRPRGSKIARATLSFTFSHVVIYKPILNFELNDSRGMVGRHLYDMGGRIIVSARKQVGYKTGALRRSIDLSHQSSAGRGQSIKIGSSLPYALMHHQGTKPHLIVPNDPKGVLVFSKGSRIIRTKVVNHPGTKPNRYLTDQLRRHVR